MQCAEYAPPSVSSDAMNPKSKNWVLALILNSLENVREIDEHKYRQSSRGWAQLIHSSIPEQTLALLSSEYGG